MRKVIAALPLLCALAAYGQEPALDVSQLRPVLLQESPWAYALPAAAPVLPASGLVIGQTQYTEGLNRFTFDSSFCLGGGQVALQYQVRWETPEGKSGVCPALCLLNLRTSKLGRPTFLPVDTLARSVSPDGARVAITTRSVFLPQNDRVWILTLPGGATERSFVPYEQEEKLQRTVVWARFVDATRLLTLNNSRKLFLWDLAGKTSKALWSLELPASFRGEPVLSPDLKYLAHDEEKSVYLLDVRTGQVAGVIHDFESAGHFRFFGAQLAFAPDGKTLARATPVRVKIYALEGRRRVISDTFMPPRVKLDGFVWATNTHVLVNKRHLVDVGKGMIVWQYTGLPDRASTFVAGERFWAVGVESKSLVARPYQFPGEDAQKVLPLLDPETLMVCKPGLRVALEVETPNPELTTLLRHCLDGQIKRNQMQPVTSGGALRVRAKVTDISPVDPKASTRAASRKQQLRLTCEADGKVLWEQITHSSPQPARLRTGDTPDPRVKILADWKDFDAIDLPRMLPAIRENIGFGETALDGQKKKGGITAKF